MAWWQWIGLWWGAVVVVFFVFYSAFGLLRKQTPEEWNRRSEEELDWQRGVRKQRRRPF